jgi:hypothetical protein
MAIVTLATATAVTVSEYVVVTLPTPAALAVIVAVYMPAATVLATVTVTVACVVFPVSWVGVTDVVTPVGSPDTATFTAASKPPPRTSVTVTVPLEPCGTVSAPGAAETAMVPVGSVPPSSPHPIAVMSAMAAMSLGDFSMFGPSTRLKFSSLYMSAR